MGLMVIITLLWQISSFLDILYQHKAQHKSQKQLNHASNCVIYNVLKIKLNLLIPKHFEVISEVVGL